MKIYIIVFFISCTVEQVFAQTDTLLENKSRVYKNQFGFEVGLNSGYLKDKNFSYSNYKETGALFSVNYTRAKPNGKYVLITDVDFSSGQLTSNYTDNFTSKYIFLNVEVSFLYRLPQFKNEKVVVLLGPQLNTNFQYVDWDDRKSWSYLAAHGLSVKGLAKYKISEKKGFQTSLSVPVLLLLVRPPYNGYDLYIQQNRENILALLFRGDLSSFNRYLNVDWKTTYEYTVSNRVNCNLGYLFRYQRVYGNNSLKHIQNQFTAGFSIKI